MTIEGAYRSIFKFIAVCKILAARYTSTSLPQKPSMILYSMILYILYTSLMGPSRSRYVLHAADIDLPHTHGKVLDLGIIRRHIAFCDVRLTPFFMNS
jgi:hypothetical protein